MPQTREEFIQDIADELNSGRTVLAGNSYQHNMSNVYDFICGHDELCEQLEAINISAMTNACDAQNTQYRLDKLAENACYDYASLIADDVSKYRRSVSLDALEGGYDGE